MSPKRRDLNDPEAWIAFASSDLALARKGNSPEVRRAALCYLCQQAAEKATKAVLIKLKVDFPMTHQIQALFKCVDGVLEVPNSVREAVDLSDYAVEGRYPQNFEDVTVVEYKSAFKKALAVVQWARKVVRSTDIFGGPSLREPQAAYSGSLPLRRAGKAGKPRRKARKALLRGGAVGRTPKKPGKKK